MANTLRTGLACCLISLALGACSDGGGDRAEGVNPGPNPPNGPVVPESPQLPGPPLPAGSVTADSLTASDQVVATIIGVSMNSPTTVSFTLVANGTDRVTGVDNSAIRASLAKLVTGGNFSTLDWTSDIRTQEDPVCRSAEDVADSNNACTTFVSASDPDIDQSDLKVNDPVATGQTVRDHVTTEAGGSLVEADSGSYAYTLVTDPGDPATLPDMHRICLQISLNAPANNACIDFVPVDLVNPAIGDKATSLDDGFYSTYTSRQIADDGSCNTCHDALSFHGGGRTATQYCVTCHNPVSVDANSENSVDLKVMAHRIHYSKNLPSVEGGTAYKIWGFRNSGHDYSNVSYPQPASQCVRCHAGQEDFDYAAAEGLPAPIAVMTPDGHRWATYQGREACESCHEDKLSHGGGGSRACYECHDNVQERHRDEVEENARALSLAIESVSNTGPGDSPVVTFTLSRNGAPIDIQNSGVFDGKLLVGIPWDGATDFDNVGISGFSSLNIEEDAIANSSNLGGNRFRFNLADATSTTVAAGQDTVGIMLFGHENASDGQLSAIKSELGFAPSTASSATPRRQVVDIAKCDNCHHRLAMTDNSHAGFHAAPAENPELCTGCHGPGLGFSGVSTDFRVLVHGLHASGIRQTPYRGFDTNRLQYPGNLADCQACHLPGTHTLPVPVNSVPLKDGSDTAYSTPVGSACGACHDSDSARAHMVQSGGALFGVAQSEAANAVEACDTCHRTGASADVDVVHNK